MCHHVRQPLQIDDWVSIKDIQHGSKIVSIHETYFEAMVCILDSAGYPYSWDINDGPAREKKEFPIDDYEYTYVASPDNKSADEDVWTECEQHYGINHLGSSDPDPVRQLAFAILRGDPIAVDIAQDVLIRGK